MGLKLTNEEGYSLSVAAWLADDDYDHAPVEGPYISATSLLKPIRMIVLDQRQKALIQAADDYEVIDISRYVPSRLGTAIHASIENTWKGNYNRALRLLGHPDKVVKRVQVNPSKEDLERYPEIIPVYMEQRSYKKVDGYTIGGKFDFVGDGILEDFKSMGVYGYMKGDKDEEQRLQGSIYRWLNPDIITSDYMLIQQIFTDWSKLDASIKKNRGYPQQRILPKKLQLMTLKETDNWVKKRIRLIHSMVDTPEKDLPPCTKKELWQDATTYKYYKNPDKTSSRSTANFDDFASAQTRYVKDGCVGVVKEFPGKVKRCGYCPAFDLCTQKNEYQEAGILKMP